MTQRESKSSELADRTIQRRAVEAVIWGMPVVNFDLMYQAATSLRASFNQIVYWSRLPDWKNQTLTPNPDSIYLMPFYDTKDVGAVVVEIPPADDGTIVGSLMDCWQTALEDVGPAGISQGQLFDGGNTYRLNIPANPPVRQYWSATVYDRATHALIREMQRSSRSSQNPELQKNADGSVDLYFGPKPPAGKEPNWVPTNTRGKFEVLFRLYGPEKALFDKTWKLLDIEMAAARKVQKAA